MLLSPRDINIGKEALSCKVAWSLGLETAWIIRGSPKSYHSCFHRIQTGASHREDEGVLQRWRLKEHIQLQAKGCLKHSTTVDTRLLS